MCPTDEARCYATFRTTRYFWILKKKILRGYVSVSHQKELSFGEYRRCSHFREKESQGYPLDGLCQ